MWHSLKFAPRSSRGVLSLRSGGSLLERQSQSQRQELFSLFIFLFSHLAVRAGLAIPRAIHELIWGLFFINIFGLDPLVAVLAIAIPFGAITAKVFQRF